MHSPTRGRNYWLVDPVGAWSSNMRLWMKVYVSTNQRGRNVSITEPSSLQQIWYHFLIFSSLSRIKTSIFLRKKKRIDCWKRCDSEPRSLLSWITGNNSIIPSGLTPRAGSFSQSHRSCFVWVPCRLMMYLYIYTYIYISITTCFLYK